MKTLHIFVLLSGLPLCLAAQTYAPKHSNEFLTLGVSARATAMGGAFTAVVDDVTAGYWNPAGLQSLAYTYEGSLMHFAYFSGVAHYDYLGFATRLEARSVAALSVIRLGIDDIPDTRFLYDANGALNYNNIQFFSASDYAFLFSYARRLKAWSGIDVGGSAKVIYRHVGNFATAWGYGLDFGMTQSIQSFKIGLMLKDLTGTYNTWSHRTDQLAVVYAQTNNRIPKQSLEITLPRAILGVSYTILSGKKQSPRRAKDVHKIAHQNAIGVLVSMDLEATFDGRRNTLLATGRVSIDPKVGVEAHYLSKFFLRIGASQFQQVQRFDRSAFTAFQLHFGVGVRLKNVSIDYALAHFGVQAQTPYSHVVSLKAGFEGKK